MISEALVSLGILKVNWDEKRTDYLENFVPFAAECIRLGKEEVVSANELQEVISTSFALYLPLGAVNSLLVRMKKRKLLRVDHGAYYRNSGELQKLDFAKRRDRVTAAFDDLVTALAEFVSERFSTFWTVSEAGDALLAYLNTHNFAITLSRTENRPLAEPTSAPQNGDYLVAHFLWSLAEENSDLLTGVDILAKATMLANAIYLPNPAAANRKFKHTSVYFDTAFLLFALGHGGQSRLVPRTHLLRLLYEANADLCVFEHTVQESRSALLACALVLESGRSRGYGPSMAFFQQEGMSGSDVRLLAARIEEDCEALRVSVVPKPPYDSKYQINEAGLESALRSGVGYREDLPLQRDVDSVSAVMRLRRGHRPREVEDSKAILVTTNSKLIQSANEYLRSDENIGVVAPCVSDYTMTNILWLKYPLLAPELPKQRLIADCFAATEPSDGLWRKYTDEILRLERGGKYGADDVYLLRHSLEARHALMDATYGDVAAFSEGTISDILKGIKETILSEARSEVADEQAKGKEQERKIAEISSELAKAKQEDVARKAHLRHRARAQSRALIVGLRAIAIGLLVVATAYSFPWNLPRFEDSIVRYGVAGLLALLFITVLMNLITGGSLNSWLRSLETRMEERLYSRLVRLGEGSVGETRRHNRSSAQE